MPSAPGFPCPPVCHPLPWTLSQGRGLKREVELTGGRTFGNDVLDRTRVGALGWGSTGPRGQMPRLGVRMGRGVKVGMGMCMQAYLLPLQGCLTVKIYGTSSLPAAFPGSSFCFQDCKDDSGKWHAESFPPALALR